MDAIILVTTLTLIAAALIFVLLFMTGYLEDGYAGNNINFNIYQKSEKLNKILSYKLTDRYNSINQSLENDESFQLTAYDIAHIADYFVGCKFTDINHYNIKINLNSDSFIKIRIRDKIKYGFGTTYLDGSEVIDTLEEQIENIIYIRNEQTIIDTSNIEDISDKHNAVVNFLNNKDLIDVNEKVMKM